MYLKYVGGGKQLQLFRDGGYFSVPITDLSQEQQEALKLDAAELLASGLWEAGEPPASEEAAAQTDPAAPATPTDQAAQTAPADAAPETADAPKRKSRGGSE